LTDINEHSKRKRRRQNTNSQISELARNRSNLNAQSRTQFLSSLSLKTMSLIMTEISILRDIIRTTDSLTRTISEIMIKLILETTHQQITDRVFFILS
jgi:hypothetical protein